MSLVIKPPSLIRTGKYTIFLAGSIDQDTARNWQKEVEKALEPFDVVVLNPRRDSWDSSWIQGQYCEPFRSQVIWELEGLRSADCIVFCFTRESIAPITLYELGKFNTLNKDCFVCVEEGFHRQANLEIYLEYSASLSYNTLDDLLKDLKTHLWVLGFEAVQNSPEITNWENEGGSSA